MITVRHSEGMNHAGAVALAHMGSAEIIAAGLGSDEMILHWEYNCVVAADDEKPVGIIVWSEEKHVRGLWVTLSYVLPDHRGHGVYKAMWAALVDKAVELKAIRIRSMTSSKNNVMRAVAAKQGRTEEAIQLVYLMPPVPDGPVISAVPPESTDDYRKRLLLLVGPGSSNYSRIEKATAATLDEIGAYYVGGARRR